MSDTVKSDATTPDTTTPDVVASLGTLLVAGSLFAIIARRVERGETESLDHSVRDWLQARRTHARDAIAGPVKVASQPVVAVPASLAAAWWVWRRRGRRPALTIAAAPALAATAGLTCSALLTRRDPPDADSASRGAASEPSFPSGHTTGVTAEALIVAFVPALVALVGWPLVVGVARVYRDRHWATDVLGGWVSGTAVAAACALLYAAAGGATRRTIARSLLSSTALMSPDRGERRARNGSVALCSSHRRA